MAKVVASITTSVDGYITGPDDGPGKGLGEGGERLHVWVFGARGATTMSPAASRAAGRGVARGGLVADRRGGRRTLDLRGRPHWGDENPWGCRSSSSPTAPEEQPEGDAFVDELAVIVAPVVLGGGKRLFEGFSSGSRASRRSSTTGCGRRRAP